MVLTAFTLLEPLTSDFLVRLQELDDKEFQGSPHKSRRYVADRRDLLYINSPHLTKRSSVQFRDCWIATNISRKVASHVVAMACKVAGVKRESFRRLVL